MKSRTDKDLEFLRGMEKLKAAPVKNPNYTSQLDNDVMKVKNLGVVTPETPDNFKKIVPNITEHINTKGNLPLLSGDDFKTKIASRTGAGKKLGLAAILTALGVSALPESAQASVPVQAGLRAMDEGDPMSLLTPPDAGNVEEESQMLAERNAMDDYANSPASNAAKFARIKASLAK